MECNKDEAVRAKEIAERKVTEKNYTGAKKFALKAQKLYPGLDGISQMLMTIDVYIAAEKKINGVVDWYAVLGTNPWVDYETVRKQYRKLALSLHPDKNTAIGADGAFRLVSEAWRMLSDKAKRLNFNEKRNQRGPENRPTQTDVSFASPSANGIHISTKNATSRNNTTGMNSTSVPSPNQNPGTFWTICDKCHMQYEYMRVHLNNTLRCPNCSESFQAVEKSPPSNDFKSPNLSPRQQHRNSRHHSANTATQAANEGQQMHEKLKREREEAQAAALKKRRGDVRNQMSMGSGASSGSAFQSRRGSFQAENIYGFSGSNLKPNSERELSLFEIQNMLVHKARSEIRKKLVEWSSETYAKSIGREKVKNKDKKSRKQEIMVNGDLLDLRECNGSNSKNRNKDFISGESDGNSDKKAPALSMNVPDSDFHNFDLDRIESSFGADQVWAAYDNDDGMPRYYARINKVISMKPFKMKISWLNSRSNSELGPVPWVASGFSKTCGDFWPGKHEISKTLNAFSHKVTWTKSARGVISIIPSKGDIWALYRNWSPDWNQHTPDDLIHSYDMVEVLEDLKDEQGVSVAPLVKVPGFRAVFQKHVDPKEVRRIPKVEMFRFSHQVPSYLLTGKEAENAPAGSWELDPAATPLDLLQVITTDASEEKLVENGGGKADEGSCQNAPKVEVAEMVEHGKNTDDKV